MTKEELKEILGKHKKWLRCKQGGVRIDLHGSNLRYCDLSGNDLTCCILRGCDLSGSNLSGCNLRGSDLRNSDLSYARLHCDLGGSDLRGCDLGGCNLEYSNLAFATLDENEKIRKGIILKEPMIGYKKCRNHIIVKLEIPKGAIVFSINNKQCRTNKAKVVYISNGNKEAVSGYDCCFIYKLGEEIEIEDFDLEYNIECTTGIHFFKTIKEAEEYVL